MNRSNPRFDPPGDNAADEPDVLCEEALERGRKVRHAIEAGLALHRQGNLRHAADFYYHVLELHADQADALHLLGLISYQSDETDAALRLVARATASDPSNAVFHISRGDILQALGRLAGAVEAYRDGLALDPELPEGYNNCGNALHAQDKLAEAAGFYQHAIAIRPGYSAAHNNLGNVLRDQGRIEDSITSFETALCYAPDFATVHNNLGNALRDAGRVDEAISSHRRALALEPDFAEAHFNLGNALSETASLDAAATSYRQAVAIRPDFADAHYNLGNALRDDGCGDQAIAAYRQAIAIKPAHGDAHNNLANLLKDDGRYDEARRHFQIVLRLDPASANAQHMLAALDGRTTEIAPRRYIREMFDRYAAIFDRQLVAELDYRAPEQLCAAVARCHAGGFGAALDLGCGTGLVAEAFAGVVERFDGIDLSPRMLVEARRKDLYETLEEAELVAYLQRSAGGEPVFDAVLAADAFIYIGDLEPVFAGVAGCLAPGGVFAFSIEITEAETFELRPTGRYTQSDRYIRGLARAHGFSVETIEACVIRMENGVAVDGALCVLINRPASPAQRPSAVQTA